MVHVDVFCSLMFPFMQGMFSAKIELSMDHIFLFDGSPVCGEV